MTDSQKEVLSILRQHGPLADHVLVPITQHAGDLHQSSSGIRSRRKELLDAGKVREHSKVKMPSGRYARLYEAV